MKYNRHQFYRKDTNEIKEKIRKFSRIMMTKYQNY